MLFISERRLRGFVRATLTLSPRPEHSRRPAVNTQADQVHGLGQYLGSGEAVPRIVRQDFHWVKTDWAVVLLLARCGRTLLDETALSVGSADNVTVHPWVSYGRSVSRF